MEQSRKRARPGQPLAAPVVRSLEDNAQSRLAADLARDLDGKFEPFVERYGDRLFAFALTLTGNRSEAEEIAQDAFVSALSGARALRARTPPHAPRCARGFLPLC